MEARIGESTPTEKATGNEGRGGANGDRRWQPSVWSMHLQATWHRGAAGSQKHVPTWDSHTGIPKSRLREAPMGRQCVPSAPLQITSPLHKPSPSPQPSRCAFRYTPANSRCSIFCVRTLTSLLRTLWQLQPRLSLPQWWPLP